MRKSFPIGGVLSLVLASSWIFGCQPALDSQNPPSSESQATLGTSTQIFTQAATSPTAALPISTMTAQPNLSGVEINASDLPQGFAVIPSITLSANSEDLSGQSFSNEHVFLFYEASDDQMLVGFSTLLVSEADQAGFDEIIEKPERAIQAFTEFYGVTGITLEPRIAGLDTLADAQSDINITINTSRSVSYRLAMSAFRKNDIGVYMIDMYSLDKNGTTIFPDFANRLANSIPGQDTAPGNPQYQNPQVNWIEPGSWLVPEGYETVNFEDIGISNEQWLEAGFDNDTQFAYRHPDGPKVIFGFNLVFETYEDVGIFQAMISDPDPILLEFASLLGAEQIDGPQRTYNVYEDGPYNIYNIADAQTGRTLNSKINDQPYQIELLIFREDNIGLVILGMQPSDTQGPITPPIQDHAAKLDLLISATGLFRPDFTLTEIIDVALPDPTALPAPDTSTLPPGPEELSFIDHLPAGFLNIPEQVLDVNSEQLSGKKFSNERMFLLLDRIQVQKVVGFTTLLNSSQDKTSFDALIENPEEALEGIADFYQATFFEFNTIRKPFVDLGEAQSYTSMTLYNSTHTKGLNVELLAFRRADTGFFILNTHSAFYQGLTVFPDFANTLVEKMDANTEQSPTTPTATPQNPTAQPPYDYPESKTPMIAWVEPGMVYTLQGYERVGLNDIGITGEEWGNIGLDYDTLFIYRHLDGPKIILGYNKLLRTYQDLGKFDMQVLDVDPTLEQLAAAVGAVGVRDQAFLSSGAFGSTDCDRGRTLIAEIKGIPYRFEMVKVREENIGFLVFTIEPPTQKNPFTASQFTRDACFHSIGLLPATDDFRMDFPIFTAADFSPVIPTP